MATNWGRDKLSKTWSFLNNLATWINCWRSGFLPMEIQWKNCTKFSLSWSVIFFSNFKPPLSAIVFLINSEAAFLVFFNLANFFCLSTVDSYVEGNKFGNIFKAIGNNNSANGIITNMANGTNLTTSTIVLCNWFDSLRDNS